jgi:outer membrane biosynthesis protein TonB
VLPHHASPAPKIDKGTLNKLREMTRKTSPAPAPPAPTPAPVAEAHQPAPPAPTQPAQPLPSAPSPIPRSSAQPVPDTPLPQPAPKPNFNSGGTVSDQMRNLASNPAPRAGSIGAAGISGYTRGGRGASAGVGGPEILSDTRGVDFQPYLARLMRQIYQQWIPLIPEEAQPPISKQGVTQVRFKINADGSLGGIWLDGPSGDVALDRAAWGSVNGQIFPPLPKQFLGPNLELRIHYLVNTTKE